MKTHLKKIAAGLGLLLLSCFPFIAPRAEAVAVYTDPSILAYFASLTFSKAKIIDLSKSTCGARDVADSDPCGAAFGFCEVQVQNKTEEFLDANCKLDESQEDWLYTCTQDQVDALQAMLKSLDGDPFLQKAKECAAPSVFIYNGPLGTDSGTPAAGNSASGGGCSLAQGIGDSASWFSGTGLMLGLFFLARLKRNKN